MGFPGTVEQLRTVVANLRLALEFASELQAALPPAAAMLRGEAAGDAPEACALVSALASLRVDGAAEAARGLLPLVFAREPAAREAACAALRDLYVGFGEEVEDEVEEDADADGSRSRGAPGAPDPAAAAARLASLAAGASEDELECVQGLVARLSGAASGEPVAGAAAGASPLDSVGGFSTAVVGVVALQEAEAAEAARGPFAQPIAAAVGAAVAAAEAPALTRAIARELWALAGRAEVEVGSIDQELLARRGDGATASAVPPLGASGSSSAPAAAPRQAASEASLRSTRLSMTLARRGALRVLSHLAAARPLWFGAPERAALRRAAATDPDAASASAALDALGRLAGEPRKADWEVDGFRRPGAWWTGDEDVRACVRALLLPPRGERRGARWFEVAEASLRALFARHVAADAVAAGVLQELRGRVARAHARAAEEAQRAAEGARGGAREGEAERKGAEGAQEEASKPPAANCPQGALHALARLLHAAGLVAMLRLAVVEDTLSEARKKAHADRDRARETKGTAASGEVDDADPGGELAAAAAAAQDAQLEDDADDAEREVLGRRRGGDAAAAADAASRAPSAGLAQDAALALALVEAGPAALAACPPALRSAALGAAARFAAADERLAGRFVAALLKVTGWEDLGLGGADVRPQGSGGDAAAAADSSAPARGAFEGDSCPRAAPVAALASSLPVRDRRTLAAAAADVAARWPRAAGGAAGAVRLARSALRDPSPAVRGDAASALARLLLCGAARGPGAEAALAACLADPAPRARTAGRAYFAELSSRETRASAPFHDALPDAVGALAADPAVPPARARAAAVELLGSLSADRRGDEAAARVARRLPAAETARARVTLAFALASAPIGERAARAAATPQVARALRRALAEDPAVRAAIAQGIARARARGGRGCAGGAAAGADEEGGAAAAGGEATGGREDLKGAIDALEAALVASEGDPEEEGSSRSTETEGQASGRGGEPGAEGGEEGSSGTGGEPGGEGGEEGSSGTGGEPGAEGGGEGSPGAGGGGGGGERASSGGPGGDMAVDGGRERAAEGVDAPGEGRAEAEPVAAPPEAAPPAPAGVRVKLPPAGDEAPRVRDAIPAGWNVKPEVERA